MDQHESLSAGSEPEAGSALMLLRWNLQLEKAVSLEVCGRGTCTCVKASRRMVTPVQTPTEGEQHLPCFSWPHMVTRPAPKAVSCTRKSTRATVHLCKDFLKGALSSLQIMAFEHLCEAVTGQR